jgi:hypothetical protein
MQRFRDIAREALVILLALSGLAVWPYLWLHRYEVQQAQLQTQQVVAQYQQFRSEAQQKVSALWQIAQKDPAWAAQFKTVIPVNEGAK